MVTVSLVVCHSGLLTCFAIALFPHNLPGYCKNTGGTKDCDHWHQGAGFVTSHMGLTLMFEQSLQSINPAVSVPYWDFTLESTFFGAADFRSSGVFADDWFGVASTNNVRALAYSITASNDLFPTIMLHCTTIPKKSCTACAMLCGNSVCTTVCARLSGMFVLFSFFLVLLICGVLAGAPHAHTRPLRLCVCHVRRDGVLQGAQLIRSSAFAVEQ